MRQKSETRKQNRRRTNRRVNQTVYKDAKQKEALRCHWKNPKYGDSTFRCPHAREFPQNLSSILGRQPQKSHQPCPGPKKYRSNVNFKGRRIICFSRFPFTSSDGLLAKGQYIWKVLRPAISAQIFLVSLCLSISEC
jgi:hypothetical protein